MVSDSAGATEDERVRTRSADPLMPCLAAIPQFLHRLTDQSLGWLFQHPGLWVNPLFIGWFRGLPKSLVKAYLAFFTDNLTPPIWPPSLSGLSNLRFPKH